MIDNLPNAEEETCGKSNAITLYDIVNKLDRICEPEEDLRIEKCIYIQYQKETV